MSNGEIDHRVGHRHLEIHARLCRAQQDLDIARLNVAPVFAEVHGDAVRARLLGEQGGHDRIGVASATCLTQCRDVVDVHAEMNGCRVCHLANELQSATHDVLQYQAAL